MGYEESDLGRQCGVPADCLQSVLSKVFLTSVRVVPETDWMLVIHSNRL